MANDFVISRIVPDFGTKMAALPANGSLGLFLGQSFDREIRSVAFQADTARPDLVMDWDLVQTATDYEPEGILLSGKIEGMDPKVPELEFPASGTPGFHRSLKLVFTETSTDQADAIGQLAITIRFDNGEPPRLRSPAAGLSRQNASVLMERAQSKTNMDLLSQESVNKGVN